MSGRQYINPQRRSDDEDGVYDQPGHQFDGEEARNRANAASQKAGGVIDDIDSLLDREENPSGESSQIESEDTDRDSSSAASGEELASTEASEATEDEIGYSHDDEDLSRTERAKVFVKKHKKGGIAGIIVGLLFGGGFGFFTLISGPLQFVHVAQLLEQFHFSRIDDFTNDRSMRTMLYAIAGKGERSRLHFVSNKAADKFEAGMLKDHGVKPIFTKTTGGGRVFAGWEIVDENKAASIVEAAQKDGATVHSVGNEGGKKGVGKETGSLVGGRSSRVDPNHRMIDARVLKKARLKGRLIHTVTKATDINKVASNLVARVLTKRDGVDFHPLKNLVRDKKQSLRDYRRKVKEEKAKEIQSGTSSERLGTPQDQKGENGKGGSTDGDKASLKAGTEGANALVDEAAKQTTKEAIQKLVAKGVGGPMIAIGIFCAAEQFSNNIPLWKLQNHILPMLRMGMDVITTASQIQSGQGVNMDELSALSASFYNSDNKTSWDQAKSVQAELDEKQTGPDLPADESLKGEDGKPLVFKIIDTLNSAGLGVACSVLSSVGHIPVIKQIGEFVSSLSMKAIDVALSIFHTSIEKLMGDALAAAAGKSINTDASGAEYGNLINTGAYLASNDQMTAMGGAQLTPSQTTALNNSTQQELAYERENSSLYQRYINPNNYYSLVGSLISSIPATWGQLASSLSNPLKSFGSIFSSMLSAFNPAAQAATNQPYSYGMPTYGFSLADQDNPEFEDPYENADVVEPQLANLNRKYSKCFGVKAIPDTGDDGVKLEYDTQNTFNILDVQANDGSDCDPSQNQDPMFLRYRFYLADLSSAKAMACWEVNDAEACSELGVGDGSDATTGGATNTPTGGVPSGSAQQLATQILANQNITLAASAKNDIQATADGKPAQPGPDGNGASGAAGRSGCQPVNLNPALLQTALSIAQKYKYQINDIVSGHQCDSAQHPKGRAMDIFYINGQPLNDSWWAQSANVATINDIGNIVHGVGSYQFGFGVGCSAVSKIKNPGNLVVFNDSCSPQDEIHIDVRGAP